MTCAEPGAVAMTRSAPLPFSVTCVYRGTSLIRKRTPLGPYSRTMPMALWGSWGGGLFLMSEVLL